MFKIFVAGVCMIGGYMLGAAQMAEYQKTKPASLVPTRAVAFTACGDTAGILVIQSDGSSVWHRPPFHGLAEIMVRIPDGEKMGVAHCPPLRDLADQY